MTVFVLSIIFTIFCVLMVGVFVHGTSGSVDGFEGGVSLGVVLGAIGIVLASFLYYNLALSTVFSLYVNDRYEYRTVANCKVIVKDKEEVVYRVCKSTETNE